MLLDNSCIFKPDAWYMLGVINHMCNSSILIYRLMYVVVVYALIF